MLFISDIQYYVPVKLCKTAGSIHLFKITEKVMTEKVKLNMHYIWNILEIDWSEAKVTFNGKVINLPKSITVRFRKMAREISLVCDFIFRSIHTSLLTDMMDIELTLRTIKGIYTYRKVHMAKSMVFLPWSRTMIPYPSLHRKMEDPGLSR